jgi:hypothetical protein
MAVTMKSAVFWDIKPQFVLHRRHITSPHTSTGETGHPHHNKTVQGAQHNSGTGKRKKQTVKCSRFLQCIQLERLKMADWGRNM